MRNLHGPDIERYRDKSREVERMWGFTGDETCGRFYVPQSNALTAHAVFCVIASNAAGWDHVSVSLPHRCPTWDEMEHIKRTFFEDDEIAMQLHVPPSDHISRHPHCLHLWRPHDVEIPLPPKVFV